MNMEPGGVPAGEVAPLDLSPSPGPQEEGEEEEEDVGREVKNAVEEFHGAGAVLGELGVLENNKSHVLSIQCETPVRVSVPHLMSLAVLAQLVSAVFQLSLLHGCSKDTLLLTFPLCGWIEYNSPHVEFQC